MKTNRFLSLAAVAALTLTASAYAQYQSADDGITASPKVRQMLNERKASAPARASAAMACEKCQEVRSAKMSPQAKGAEIMMGSKQVSYMHGCPACDTQTSVAGEGKSKHQVATHRCTMQAPSVPGCCDAK